MRRAPASPARRTSRSGGRGRTAARQHLHRREALVGPAAPRGTGLVAWRAVVSANGFDVPAVTGEAWGRGGLFGAARLTQDRLYWFASARGPEASDGSRHAERELLLERFADWHAPIPQIIESTAAEASIRTPLREILPLETWVSGRVGLLGDAAHAMLPNLGQGGCQAIEDAATLAASMANSADVPIALRAYERSRKPRAENIARQSRRMSGLAHQRNPAAAALRNIAMRATPTGRHKAVSSFADVNERFLGEPVARVLNAHGLNVSASVRRPPRRSLSRPCGMSPASACPG